MKLLLIAQSVQNHQEDHNIGEDRISALHSVVGAPEAEPGRDGGDGGEDVDGCQE